MSKEIEFGKPEDWVFITATNEVIHKTRGWRFPLRNMTAAFGGPVRNYVSAGIIKRYSHEVFCTNASTVPDGCWNSYREGQILQPTSFEDYHLPPELQIVLNNLSNHDSENRAYLDQWLAYGFRNPGASQCALVLHGIHGSGKSTLAAVLSAAYGEYAATVGPLALESTFNSWIENKLLIVAEEISASSFREREKVMNTLKAMVIRSRLQINRKGVPQYEIENLTRWLIFSNSKSPVHIEPTERRYSVIHSTEAISPAVGAKIATDLKFYAQRLVNYLANVPLDEFAPMIPHMNDDLIDVRGESAHVSSKFWHEQPSAAKASAEAWFQKYIQFCTHSGQVPCSKIDFARNLPSYVKRSRDMHGRWYEITKPPAAQTLTADPAKSPSNVN